MQLYLDIHISTEYLLETSLFFLLFTAGLVLFMVIYLIGFIKRKRTKQHLQSVYSSFLTEIILCDTKEELLDVLEKPWVQSLRKRWFYDEDARKLLIREIVKACKSLAGVASDNILWLYGTLGLQEDSLKRLRSKTWFVKARSIQELAEMRQNDQITKIYRETNSRNPYIRREAQIAVVKMTGIDGLRFLSVLSHPLSQWQQICLLAQLPDYAEIGTDRLEKWMKAPNHSVVEFALRLLVHYQRYDLISSVEAFMEHPNAAVREQAVKTIVALSPDTALSALGARLPTGSVNIKRCYLDMHQSMLSTDTAGLSSLVQDGDEDIRTEAQRLLRRLSPVHMPATEHVKTIPG
ncbi:MAG: hypothetical protein JWP27_827 [Flaviaesturariibacter sp.]|nr:hypothetical protein [Flaviaesturariibacter sp.]